MREPTSGELRGRVVFRRDMNADADPPVQDSTGDPVEDWQDLATRSARVMWEGGSETFEGKRERSDTRCTVTIRYGLTLTAKDRMTVDGLVCDIENTPHDMDGRRRWTVIKGVYRG